MSNLMKFVMTIISLAVLISLNANALTEKTRDVKRKTVISPGGKIAV